MSRQKLLKQFLPMILSVALLLGDMPITAFAAGEMSAVDGTVTAEEAVSGDDSLEVYDSAGPMREAGAESALPKAVVRVDEAKLIDKAAELGYDYDYINNAYETDYVGEDLDTYGDIATKVTDAVKKCVMVENVPDKSNATDKNMSYKWQEYDSEKKAFADMKESGGPRNAGRYQLVVSREAEENVNAASDPVVAIGLTIRKAKLIFRPMSNFDENSNVATVADVKAANAYAKIAFQRSDDPSGDYQKNIFVNSLAVSVTDAQGTVLEDKEFLSREKDYSLILNVELHKHVAVNYEVAQTSFPIRFGANVATRVELTYVDESKPIVKIYDGQAIKADELVMPALSSVKVLYKDADGEEKALDAKPAGIWCDAAGNPYADEDFAPRDAGVYYYCLQYSDPTGAYADSHADVRVEIKMADIVINPLFVPESGTTPATTLEVYEGMRVRDVLNKVQYEVYLAADETHAPMSLDEYFWGIYTDAGRTLYYQPVFAVQRGEAVKKADGTSETVWTTLTDESARLTKAGYTYRVVFSGTKAVFSPNGTKFTAGINDAQGNYRVNITDAVIAQYAKALTVKDSIYLVTNVSKILVENKGASFEDPIVKTYDEKGIYANKGEYKKAEFTVSSGNAGASVPENIKDMLRYSWQRVYYWETVNKIETVTEDCWEDVDEDLFHDVDNLCSPKYSGVYRLKVEVNDPTGLYVAEPAYVYYVIKPKDVLMKFNITNTAPEGNVDYNKIFLYVDESVTVKSFLQKLQNTNPGDPSTYINPEFIYVSDIKQSEKEVGEATLTEGDTVNNSELNSIIASMFEEPERYFYIEYQARNKDNKYVWQTWKQPRFRKDVEYRIAVKLDEIDGRGFDEQGFVYNHNFGQRPGMFNHSVLKPEISYYGCGFARVIAKESKNIVTRIEYDFAKPITTVKTYDAKPFDLTEIKKNLKVIDAENNDVTDKVKIIFEYKEVKSYSADEVMLGDAGCVHAGTYTLYARTLADENYFAADAVAISDITIQKRVVELKPLLKPEGEILAGTKMAYDTYQYVLADPSDVGNCYELKGLLEQEPDIGKVSLSSGFRAFAFYEKLSDKPLTWPYRLRSGQEYYAKIRSESHFEWNDSRLDTVYDQFRPVAYSRDYEIKLMPAAFTAKPVASDVKKVSVRLTHTYEQKDDIFVHRIRATAGVSIPYIAEKKGNFLQFRLYAPVEYQEETDTFDQLGFVYRESIKGAGGTVEREVYDGAEDLRYIVVSFDASLGGEHEFIVSWKDVKEKYIVDLENVTLQSDLSAAVLPKALAFTPKTVNLVVGDMVQLDVKVTKKKKNDVICLGYESSDESVLKVNASGFVTALKTGSAKVTVYPCRIVNGEKQRITGKGVKTATATVKVKNVSKPAGLKLTAADTYVQVRYKKPANGYRREIYVLENKKTENDFKKAIDSVRNGDYTSVFAAAPVFVTTETTDAKGIATVKVGGLSPAKTYTVYVRNVSALSLLEDSSKVAPSSSGVVKKFSTVRSQAMAVRTSIEVKENIEKYAGMYTDGYGSYDYYQVAMKLGSVDLKTEGKFLEEYSKDYSDTGDFVWLSVPLGSENKNNYTAPKMSYYAFDYKTYDYSGDGKVSGSILYHKSYNYMPTKIAAVNKNGKISLKGRGLAHILAVDNNTGESYEIVLNITANATKVEGRNNVSMQVGETIRLSDMLTYYEGSNKNKLAWEGSALTVTEESNDDFEIKKVSGNYLITALNAGKSITLHVSDSDVKQAGGSDATVKLTTKAIAAVKKPKKVAVTDEKFTAEFTYAYPELTLRWEIKDASGRLINSDIQPVYFTDYNAKKKTYVFRETFSGLSRQTTYTLKLEAIYENPSTKEIQASKKASLKVTTTNIPVSLNDLFANQINAGEDIAVTTAAVSPAAAASRSFSATYMLSDLPVLKAGNNYTLSLASYNQAAKERMSDTVIWKSKNTKVATVKALPGSYSATLKAIKSGDTTIELVSKITKKVIARWQVSVGAVGDADDYFGDYEPYTKMQYTSANERDVLQFAVGSPVMVTLNKMEAQWFQFTAPSYGCYTFNISRRDGSGSSVGAYFVDSKERVGSDGKVPAASLVSNDIRYMEKGEKLYVYLPANEKMTARIYAEGILYQDVVLGDNIVKGGQNVRLLAPEDNYYTFSLTENGQEVVTESYPAKKGDSVTITDVGQNYKEYTLKVTKRNPVVLPVKDGAQVSIAKGAQLWYVFQADEANLYNFSVADATKSVNIELFKTLMDEEPDELTPDMPIEKGDKIYLRLTSEEATDEAPVKGVLKAAKSRVPSVALEQQGANGYTYTLTAGTEVWYSFTAAEAGRYKFAFSSSVPVEYFFSLSRLTYDKTGEVENLYLNKGESVYLKLSPTVDVSGTLTVTKRNLNTQVALKADGKSVAIPAIDARGEIWLKFAADEYNAYSFTLTGIKTLATMRLYSDLEKENYDNEDRAYGVPQCVISDRVLRKCEEVFIRIDASTDKEDKLELKITKITPEPLALDGAASTFEFAAKGEVKWYELAATETNYYSFFYAFESGTAQAELYDRFIGGRRLPEEKPFTGYWREKGFSEVQIDAGKKVYLKVTADGPGSGSLKARKRTLESALKEDAPNEITLASQEPKWYRLSSADINYITAKVSATAAVNMHVFNDIMDASPEDLYNDITEETAGISFEEPGSKYIRLLYNGKDTAKVTLAISRRNLEADELVFDKAGKKGTEVKLAGKEKWYAFTSTETNVYTFYADDVKGGAVTAELYRKLSDASRHASNVSGTPTATVPASFKISSVQIAKGDKVYLRLIPAGNDETTFTLKVGRRVPDSLELSVDAAKNAFTITDAAEHWYVYEAEETGYYTFYPSVVDSNYPATFRVYPTIDSTTPVQTIASGTFKTKDYSRNEGNKIYLMVTVPSATADNKVAIHIGVAKIPAKDDATGITALDTSKDGKKFTLKYKEEVWFKYTATEDNYYLFGTSVSANMERYDYSVHEGTTFISGRGVAMKDGDEVTFRMYDASLAKDGSKEVSVTVRKREVEGTPLSAANTIELTSAVSELWYKLNVDEDNCYTIYTDSVTNDGRVSVEYYRSLADPDPYNGTATSDANGKLQLAEVPLKTTDTGYVRITREDEGSANISVSLKIRKRAAEALTATVPLQKDISLDAQQKGQNGVWYKFGAPATQNYSVLLEDVSYGDIKVECFTSLADLNTTPERTLRVTYDTKDASKNNGRISEEIYLEKNAVIYLRVSLDSAIAEGKTNAIANLKIKARTAESDTISVSPGDLPVSLKANDLKCYGFTATTAGRYVFCVKNEAKNQLNMAVFKQLSDKDSVCSASGSADFHSDVLFMAANETVYVRVSSGAREATFNIQAAKYSDVLSTEESHRMTVGTAKTISTATKSKTDQWYQFTAPSNVPASGAKIRFAIQSTRGSGSRTLEYYSSLDAETYTTQKTITVSGGDAIDVAATPGATYYLRVKTDGNNADILGTTIRADVVYHEEQAVANKAEKYIEKEGYYYVSNPVTYTVQTKGTYYFWSSTEAADTGTSPICYFYINDVYKAKVLPGSNGDFRFAQDLNGTETVKLVICFRGGNEDDAPAKRSSTVHITGTDPSSK